MEGSVYDELESEMQDTDPSLELKKSDFEIDLKTESDEIKDSTLDKLATKLLKHNFILTALELHTELVESGRELPRLRDYFSNPGNFEKHIHVTETSPVLPRTSSVQTFDSLDFTRYSDDGERQVDERVAVLEFELRKAKETIKALRTNLTFATESDPNTPTSGIAKSIVPDVVKPHEKRALNFLLNEYLLCNSYKLTSITFSDENEDQDFEDWDDVGLNIPKPQSLLQLYRNHSRYVYLNSEVANKEVQTDKIEYAVDESLPCLNALCSQEKELLATRIQKLTEEGKDKLSQANAEKEILEGQVKSLKRELKMLKMNNVENLEKPAHLTVNASEDKKSLDSTDEFVFVNKHADSPVIVNELDFKSRQDSVDTKSNSNSSPDIPVKTERSIACEFQRSLMSLCQTQKISQDNRLVGEVADIVNSQESVVAVLARCLPHIVPNILLAKREELIPLILCAVALHPDPKERDKLLNILFNLIKRPDEEQRHMILTGLVTIAQHLGPSRVEAELLPQCWEQITHRYIERRLLVAESCGALAPYVMSGIRSSLLLSMLQQMLHEDKEDLVRETVVKNLSLLLLYVDDVDKFSKVCELLFFSLEDPGLSVVESGITTLLPSLAAWSLEVGNLHAHLFPAVMAALHKHFKALYDIPLPTIFGSLQAEEQHCILYARVLSALFPFLFISVIKSGPYVENPDASCSSPIEFDVDRLPSYSSVVLSPSVILGNGDELMNCVKAFDRYLNSEWYKPWPAHDWVTNELLPHLHSMLSLVSSQRQAVVHALVELTHSFCHLFGRAFTQKQVKPSFLARLVVEEGEVSTSSGVSTSRPTYQDATIPVYVAGVLGVLHQAEDRQELLEFLQDLLYNVSLNHLPDSSLKAALVELSWNKAYHELLLSVLWEGVVHNSDLVRVAAARMLEVMVGVVSEGLLRTRVAPALVTLATDPEIGVRIATVPAFGAIMELSSQRDSLSSFLKQLLEKAHLQLQTFLDDQLYRDQHLLYVEVIRTFAKIGPNTEPKFRDEFVLPRLAALAAENNGSSNEAKKMDIALALLEAYTAMSCCFMSEQLITGAFLPGLRCLKSDLQTISPEYEESVNCMIQEFEAKLDLGRSIDNRPRSVTSPGSMEDMKNRVSKMFSSRPPNIPSLFQLRKK